jgi:hypothetical protein
VRDFALAAGAYATDGEIRRQWLFAGLVWDGADTLAGVAAGHGGYLPRRSSFYLTGFALSGVILGVLHRRAGATSP